VTVGCGEVDHGDGVLRREEARRWGHALLDIMARTTRVKGQRGEDKGVLASSPFLAVRARQVFDHFDVASASAC
jgi:hypothetical protein